MAIRIVIVTLAFFIFYYLLFFSQNSISNRVNKPAQFIRLSPKHFFQCIIRNCLQVVCAVSISRSVGTRTTYPCGHFVKPAFSKVLRLEEQQVFEQMGKSCTAGFFPC